MANFDVEDETFMASVFKDAFPGKKHSGIICECASFFLYFDLKQEHIKAKGRF